MAFLSNIGKSGDVAERSPVVISANLKEDMLLQKKMVVLNRSERSVVHQIRVDQKVLYKRFQAKLIRSKLAQARLMGQRDIQKELRSKNLGGLNTDIAGNSEEDYGFLKMLKQRPCIANSLSPRISIPGKSERKQRSQEGFSEVADMQQNGNESGAGPVGRSASARARYHRHLAENFEKCDKAAASLEPSIKLRPATSSGARVDEEFLKHQDRIKASQEIKTETETYEANDKFDDVKEEREHTVEENKVNNHSKYSDSEVGTHENEISTKSEDGDNNTPLDTKVDKKQSVAFLEGAENDLTEPVMALDLDPMCADKEDSVPDTPVSPSQMGRRASRGADFFQEEKKIDVVALHLQRAKSLDYTGHVQKFCEELEEIRGSHKEPNVDYYAMRLQLSQEQSVQKPLARVPGTPEEENKRSVGNLFIRSLTVPEINWNFNE